ncbi:MAG: hypothetical protein Q4A32_07245 [Lachnospiraceae bacterium]|nr:hypothetical protein [Lachnospiraceae bacterium]
MAKTARSSLHVKFKFLYTQPTRTARVVDLERQYSMIHPTTLGLLDALEKVSFCKCKLLLSRSGFLRMFSVKNAPDRRIGFFTAGTVRYYYAGSRI